MINQVATRYAQALFELAEEENTVSETYKSLKEVKDFITENKSIYDVFRSPFIPKDEKRNLACELFENKIEKYIKNFILILIDKDRITQIKSIFQAYEQMMNDKLNIQKGTVYTAIELDEKQIEELEKKLSAKYNKNVKLENKIDKDILGGVLVRIGNEEIDATVKTRLDELGSILSQVIS